MSERFEIIIKEKGKYDNGICIIDNMDGTTHQMLDYGSAKDVCELLNKLYKQTKK